MQKRSFLFNLFLAALVVLALLFIFFKSLNWLTNHGMETEVPDLQGKNLTVAVRLLEKQGFAIQIDSTYQAQKKPLEIVFQEPEAGAIVKVGRTIFLTVNKKDVPKVPMPNLVSLSFRNALLTMQSYRLIMGDTIYRPDLAAGSVLEQLFHGEKIRPGLLIPYGSVIDLVIGEGLSDKLDVPNLIGMPWFQAKDTIESLMLSYNILWDGTITDTMNAIIYKQTPSAINELDFKNSILAGDIIEVRIMQNPSQEILDANMPGSSSLLGVESDEDSVGKIKRIKDSTRRAKIPGMASRPKPNEASAQSGNNKGNRNVQKDRKPIDNKAADHIKNEYE